jgi:HEAT repeat protein
VTFLARALRVRTGEGRVVGLVVALMFVSVASLTIGESAVDALFLERIGAHALPLMYLAQGAVTFAVMLALTGLLTRLGRRRSYLLAPLSLGSVLIAERFLLVTGARWIYPVLWVTVAVGTLVQAIFLWGTAGAVIDTRQAKRLFPIFAAGGILGAVAGGLSTKALAAAIGAENLLLVWSVGLATAFVLVRLTLGPAVRARARRRVARRTASALRDVAQGLAFVRRSRLLTWMTVGAVLFSVLFYSLFLPFARAATDRFPNADDLAGFLGVFSAAVTGAALLASILVTNRLFVWFGVAAMIVVLPLLYAAAFGVVLVESAFVTLVIVRFVTGVWLQGVASPGWETLVNVVPEARRDQVRAFLNGGPTQAGTAIAGLVALLGQQALSTRQLAGIGLVTALLTLATAAAIRRSYTGALVEALRAGRPRVFDRTPGPLAHSLRTAQPDAEAIRTLTASLRSGDIHVRRLAFELLADWRPDPRPVELLQGLHDDDPSVRLAVVRSLDLSEPSDRRALAETIHDPDPHVAAVAAARALGTVAGSAPMTRLRELMEDREEWIRRSAVEALRHAPVEQAAALSRDLLDDGAPAVRAAALETFAAAAPEAALEPARAALHDGDPEVRLSAGRALGAIGTPALDDVLGALSDPATMDAAVEAVRALDAEGASERVRGFVASAAVRAMADRDAALAVPTDGPVATLLRDAFLDRGRRVARSALWALSMVASNRAATEAALESLDARDPIQLANALETLEASGNQALVRPLLFLWEPAQAARPAAGAEWMAGALGDGDDLIRNCAELLRAEAGGGEMSRPHNAALSVIERVILLRTVPLFADLSPVDLERVAAFAEERAYTAGETIAAEGELGAELHLVVEGTVRVVQDRSGAERDLARRTKGDVIGEMSIITKAPRVASLVAEGDVRTIRIGQREFESMLRERPDVALAVMRVLAQRLGKETGR